MRKFEKIRKMQKKNGESSNKLGNFEKIIKNLESTENLKKL